MESSEFAKARNRVKMPKKDLFPDCNINHDPISRLDSRVIIALATNSSQAHIVSDNLHDSTDEQIAKLLNLKFNNNPFTLIRQLSKDLSSKETELILLREEKAKRENELLRLCSEFGNLSYVEIDQRLNALRAEKDVHKVISNLVQAAVSDIDSNKPTTNRYEPTQDSKVNDSQDGITNARNNVISPAPTLCDHSQATSPITNHFNSRPTQKSWSHWLHWLNRSEESVEDVSDTSREANKNLRPSLHDSNTKSAVELDSIVDSLSPKIPVSSHGIDKFGFVTDVSALEEQRFMSARNSLNDLLDEKQCKHKSDFFNPSISETNVALRTNKSSTALALSQSLDKLKLLNEQYLASSEINMKHWDMLMNTAYNAEGSKSELTISLGFFGLKATNLKKHGPLLKHIFNYDDERPDDHRFFKILRNLINEKGIPPKYRNSLWFELSGAKSKAIPGEYQRLLEVSASTSDVQILDSIGQIMLDLHRTLPSNIYFNNQKTKEPGPQFSSLKNILMAFVAYKPAVSYCQGMNKLVGNIMLGVNESHGQGGSKLSEEYVFWLFVSIVEDILPCFGEYNFFHTQALNLMNGETPEFNRLFAAFLPDLSTHLRSKSIEIELIVISWWIGVFTEAFTSIDLWFDIIDGLLIAEDPLQKFLSYTLSTFKVYQRALMVCEDAPSVYKFVNLLKSGSGPNIRSNEFMTTATAFEKQIRSFNSN